MVCLCIPIAFTMIQQSMSNNTIWQTVKALFVKPTESVFVERAIEVSIQRNTYGAKIRDDEHQNHLLQKAISIYLAKHLDMTSKPGRYELIESEPVPQQKDEEDMPNDRHYDWYAGGYVDSDDTAIRKLRVGALPPLNEYVNVGDHLEFSHNMITEDENGNALTSGAKQVYFLRSYHPDGSDFIDAFVNKAFDYYKEIQMAKQKKDKSRYMYTPQATEPLSFKRYALSDEKTFDSLFFDEKAPLLSLLNDFLNKTGKFAIAGFPYKLGLLLHGPPGTGKTSLIKAIAQHTKRHIVNISLSQIKTNQELMDLLFDLKFTVPGEDLPVNLTMNKVVFVMEDIDCASNVVHKRAEVEPPSEAEVASFMQKVEDGKLDKDMFDTMDKLEKSSKMKSSSSSDKLNLAGLLNVLDGVVDAPGRLLIMTTNHPEKLDPALIRPGRVNKKMLLGLMSPRHVACMVEHYFDIELTIKQKQTIVDCMATISPAQVEQMCAEHDTIDSFLDALANI
ncbi:bcs1 aaa-type ATPase [Thraustotheca clavata]|uniref:Bcs1 aaa-type ATPase n=1 Tax=Thraustotheca clavata TaxID=74557 RepID=A0A1V9YHG0_9STRA|nr:bcs1 aaa-type ATPase [Thraustotheca clavata]